MPAAVNVRRRAGQGAGQGNLDADVGGCQEIEGGVVNSQLLPSLTTTFNRSRLPLSFSISTLHHWSRVMSRHLLKVSDGSSLLRRHGGDGPEPWTHSSDER